MWSSTWNPIIRSDDKFKVTCISLFCSLKKKSYVGIIVHIPFNTASPWDTGISIDMFYNYNIFYSATKIATEYCENPYFELLASTEMEITSFWVVITEKTLENPWRIMVFCFITTVRNWLVCLQISTCLHSRMSVQSKYHFTHHFNALFTLRKESCFFT